MKKFFTLILLIVATAAFAQKATNTWNGNFNSYWHNNNNWSLGHIPTSTEDVIIPNGMLRYPAVDIYDELINSLTIQSNAEVKIYDQTLDVSGDVNVYGELRLLDGDAVIECDDLTWHSGSSAQTTDGCAFRLYGTWEFAAGADVQLDNGYASFYGSGTQYIRSKDADCYFNDIWVNKSGGLLGLSAQSTETCKINGNITLVGNNYDFISYSSDTIQIAYYFTNTDPSIDIAIENGSIEFTGNSTCYYRPQPGDYINNLIVNTGSYSLDLSTLFSTSTEIKGDVTINSGQLDVNGMDVSVGGDWDNNVGSAGFYERDQKVTFNGSGHQYCSDETFYTLEVDKSSGALRINGTDVECDEYNWTSGAVDVLSGSFTANDLLDNAIQGSFYLNSGGTINLHNDGGYIDLKGDLFIYGGEFNVYGGSIASYWPYGEDASITMSDGVLDIKEQGIKIYNTAHALNDNITGGRIKCAGYLHLERADFTPNAGIFEMYGSTDADIKTINGSRFWDLAIDKVDGGKASGVKPFTDRDGTYYGGSKGNSANAVSNIACYSHLYIDGGTFDLGTYDFSTTGSALIYGTLKMNSASNDFSVGWDIQWRTGSTADVTAGNFHVDRHWYFESGTNAQIGSGNTLHFTGDALQYFYSYDGDAEIGNIIIENTASSAWLHSSSTHQMHVTGYMTVNSGAEFWVQNENLLVEGTLGVADGGYMSIYNGGLVTTNSDMTLYGNLEVGEGDMVVHGTFDIESTGELSISGGSFVYDEGETYCNIYGIFNITSGMFTADETIQVKSGASMNVSGGTITAVAFLAEYSNTFQPTGGTFQCQTDNGGHGTLKLHSSNYFHDLKINPLAGGGGLANSNLHVNNDLIVSAGSLSMNGYTVLVDNNSTIYGGLSIDSPDDILIVEGDVTWKPGSYSTYVTDGRIDVYGNWTFENGTNAQFGNNNTVKFIGAGSSNIYNYDADAEFGHIWAYKSSGATVYINGGSTYPVYCSGGLSVENASHFDVQHEILETEGNIYVGANSLLDMLSSGSIHCGGDLDIWGTLDLGGGEMTVEGEFSHHSTGTLTIADGSLVCSEAYDGANKFIKGNFNLSGDGIFEMTHNSVQIYSTANCNISGGTFRVGAHFFASQPGTFQPFGGTFELSDGYAGGQIFCTSDNHFYNLDINDNTIAGDDFTVDQNLNINEGTFNVNGKTVEVENDVNVYGILQMTDALSVLECGNRVSWMPGSEDDVTAGSIMTNYWTFEEGTNAMLGIGNTAYVNYGLSNDDTDAEFGNLIGGTDSKENPIEVKLYTPIRVAGDFTLLSGNSWSANADIIVQGTFDIQEGATQSLSSDNTIFTYSDFILNGTFDLGLQGNGYVEGEFEIASTGELIIEGGEFIVENSATGFNSVYGTMTMTDGLFQIDSNIKFESTAIANISGGMIRLGAIFAEIPGTFEPSGGTVEIQTDYDFSGFGYVKCNNGNFFYNLNVNRAGLSGGAILKTDILVVNDLNILVGYIDFDGNTATVNGNTNIYDGGLWMTESTDVFNAGDDPADEILWTSEATFEWNDLGIINIFGGCNIENGVTDNIEAGQTFAFAGTGDQELNNMDDATFGIIELAKPSGSLIIPSGSNVECESYDWTSGTFTLNGGDFQANDLVDAGLFGTYNFNSGEAYFIQDEEQNADINANINLYGANVTVQGTDHISGWAGLEDININMSSGVFSFIDIGIGISPGTNNLTENISGGAIRTNRSFYCFSPDFTPSGGNVELFGNYTQYIGVENGELFNLTIDKDESESKAIAPDDLPVVNLYNDLALNGKLTIEKGQLLNQTYDLSLGQGCDINDGGILDMESPGALYIGAGNSVNVNNGGLLSMEGNELDPLMITSTDGYFALNILSGGEISAINTIFEKMNTHGLKIESGALLNPLSVLTNCTFRNGDAGSTFLTIENDQELTIEGAAFVSQGGESYNVSKTSNTGQVTFTNFSGDFAGEGFEYDPHNLVEWFEPQLSVTPSALNVPANAGTALLSLEANVAWQITNTFDWLTVNPMSGSGDNTLVINFDDNTLLESRTATYIVSGEDVPDVQFTITQAGMDPVLSVTPANQDVSAALGTTTFDVTSNTSWSVSESVGWLSVSPMNGNNNNTLTVTFDENTSIDERVGEITISATGVPDVEVTVTQAGTAPFLSVTPANQDVSAAAGTTTFNLVSNTSWTVSEGHGWLSVTPASGEGNFTLLVNYIENTSIYPRSGNITISAPGAADIIVTVSQAGADAVLEVTPANRNVSAAAGTTTFDLISNVTWSVSENLDWLSVNPATGSYNATLSVEYLENTSVTPRIGNITISAFGTADVIVTVTQAGADLLLSVTPANQNVGAAAGNTTFDIESNNTWEVNESVGWLSADPLSGSGDVVLDVSYDANNTGGPRVGEITVSTAGKLSVVVTVTQDGNLPELSVDPDSFDFLAPNGIAMLNVYSNTTWIISDDMDWLGLNLDTPAGDQVVQVSVQMNNTGVVRTGEITVETEDGSIEIIIPVTQQPFVEHIISLPAGWSGMSSYALPTPPFIEGVFSGIEDDLVIAIGETGMYYPAENVNTIGMWEAFSAYKVKMEAAVDLEIYGSAYPDKTMTIPVGWSMLPVISECDVDVEMLFAAVADEVVMVKDIAGYGVYWPEMGINTIGELLPGKAYFVLMNNQAEIEFPACGKSENLSGATNLSGLEDLSGLEIQATPSTHTIAILPEAHNDLEMGTIIGAYDQNGNCYGATQIANENHYITIFGDDQTTPVKDGFYEKEIIIFKNLSGFQNLTGLQPTFNPQLPHANGLFTENGLSAITGFKESTGISNYELLHSVNIYPNPSSGKIFIEGFVSGSTVSIIDMHGQLVFEKTIYESDVQQISLEHLDPGAYMVIIKNDLKNFSHKLILK